MRCSARVETRRRTIGRLQKARLAALGAHTMPRPS
jgi:hypothetical protein